MIYCMTKAMKKERGQVMILSVILMSGAILSATMVASFLMVYHMRQATDLANSAKAIFAADAGVEWQFYRVRKDANYPAPVFTNGTQLQVVQVEPNVYRCIGSSARSARAFEINVTTLLP